MQGEGGCEGRCKCANDPADPLSDDTHATADHRGAPTNTNGFGIGSTPGFLSFQAVTAIQK
jgi:hypothetical protein